jgi:hypothetical protein
MIEMHYQQLSASSSGPKAGGVCSNGTDTVTGVVYFVAAQNEIVSAALNSGRTNGFMFLGVKP